MKKEYLSPEMILNPIFTSDIITASAIEIVSEGDGSGDNFNFPV